MNKNRNTRILKKILLVLLIAVFLYSAFQVIDILMEYNENELAFEEVRDEFVEVETPQPKEPPDAGIPHAGGQGSEQTYTEPLWDMDVKIDFAGLKAINRQVIGWIMVPDSPINYPIMKAADNQKYLNRTLHGKYNVLGSIFMDFRNKSDYSDPNTIIYGHNVRNGAMFGSLHQYKNEEYLDSHRYVYIITEEGTRVYEIFSAFVTDIYDDVYDFDLQRGSADKDIITLSTCTSSGRVNERYVIQGKQIFQDSASL